ncbi:hypothetical protein [Pradoshia sp.]
MILGAIWDNPILIFIIISLISWFFGRDKTAEQKNESPAPEPVETDKEVIRESRNERSVTQRAGGDDEIRRRIQERERQLQKKLSRAPELEREAKTLAQSIKEQYERQKAQFTEPPAKEKQPEPVVTVPVQLVKKAISEKVQPKKHKEPSKNAGAGMNLRGADLRQAIIMSEILGPPRSKRKQIR